MTFPIIAHFLCSTALPAVESCFCLWVVIVHADNQTLGGHLFLNLYTNQLPAHPFVHPSIVSLLRQRTEIQRQMVWDGPYFLLISTFKRKIFLSIGGVGVSVAPITQQCF